MPYGEGKPELADTYAAIANETLDAIARTSLSDHESRCIHYLWRKTYGWTNGQGGHAKKTDVIAYSQWSEGTSLDKHEARRTLNNLVTRNIVSKQLIKLNGKNSITIWGFRKYYKEWIGYKPPKEGASQPPLDSQEGAQQPLLEYEEGASHPPVQNQEGASQPPVSYKEGAVLPKEGASQPPEEGASQPPTISTLSTTTISILCSDYAGTLKKLILKNNPKAKTPEDLTKWAKEFEHMINIDKRSSEDITTVMEFCQKDPFWQSNILSASKLREKFDQLYLKMKAGGSYGGKKSGVHKPGYSTSVPTHYTEPEEIFGKPSSEASGEEAAEEGGD